MSTGSGEASSDVAGPGARESLGSPSSDSLPEPCQFPRGSLLLGVASSSALLPLHPGLPSTASTLSPSFSKGDPVPESCGGAGVLRCSPCSHARKVASYALILFQTPDLLNVPAPRVCWLPPRGTSSFSTPHFSPHSRSHI